MPWLTRRSAEWSLLVVLILVLMGVFGQQIRAVQGQAERAAIKTTLGALRTALVIDHLQSAAGQKGKTVASPQRNPFLLLDHLPANYAGVLGNPKADAAPAGNWVFDAYCNCIGYGPMYPYALETGGDDRVLWFRVSAQAGPLTIAPMHTYRWQGDVID
jgi:hypothetical protein